MLIGPSTGDKVYHGILLELNRIVEEDNLRPGDKLPSERELSERLKVGRSSVREALRALELLGLITTRRGEGTFIEHYRHNKLFDILGYYLLRDRKATKDLSEMRMILELDAVRLACTRANDKYIQIMEQSILDAEDKIRSGLSPVEEDFEFHRAIARASRNSVLQRIWIPIIEYSKTIRENSLTNEVTLELMIEQHRGILESIRNRNPEQAEERMREHLTHKLVHDISDGRF
ncbi:FadR/GntR family transcriptional regulator [Ammoniphilus sp. CFH 90114]|uniref:FadR/GntR family transcriptional regulator n=1 Tax=Ammoniphilus sp. CFH 90114 TaxID=2493665 RepID=UPI00100EE025|nr:FadR/GntR family transcriptional regulator [Ammoniphilus sp. CFH 90114]RXT04789.1 FadR family transcriptional regulator [Ammoniphilus sp. CFH 90114]